MLICSDSLCNVYRLCDDKLVLDNSIICVIIVDNACMYHIILVILLMTRRQATCHETAWFILLLLLCTVIGARFNCVALTPLKIVHIS